MNLADASVWLDYHYWARDVMLDAVAPLSPEQFTRQTESSFRSIRDTAAHIYGADLIWYTRWMGQSPTSLLSYDSFSDVAAIRAAWADLERAVRPFINGLGEQGLSRVVEYKLMNGQPGASPFWQMLVHVVNHASYHRGQVTTLLRQVGAPPPKSMDMIAFFRR